MKHSKNIRKYLQFWGKAHPEEQQKILWHPLAYHSLDVAAVALSLQKNRQQQTNRIAQTHSLPLDDFIRFNTFLIALHDLGKFSRSFQGLVPEHWPPILGEYQETARQAHWQTSSDLLRDRLIGGKLRLYFDPTLANHLSSLFNAIAGHHGKPPEIDKSLDTRLVCDQCQASIISFIDELLLLLQPPKSLPLNDILAKSLSYWLAGLTVAADWLGSNQQFFAYHENNLPLADYWRTIALPQAEHAIAAAGLLPSMPDHSANLASLFNIKHPRPMQTLMADLDLSEGPALVIIEDATGSGKTEAAVLLAQRMMRHEKAGGLYFALPTMATANGMFTRMQGCYRKLFAKEIEPSLALAHGRANEHDGFRKVTLPQEPTTRTLPGKDEETASQCAAWIADDRRKTFFAQIGVGTIDQSLLAVLPSKFQSLRLWGLSDRILIIDEAHAYDAYMSRELDSLLEFHAALGGSAIILSATLPAQKRRALVAAFQKGLGQTGTSALKATNTYPLVTIADKESIVEIKNIDPAQHTIRTVKVERMENTDEALLRIAEAAAKGAAVAYVRNAVDDAIEAVAKLQDLDVDADLFHARYMMGDRQRIEQDAVARFGVNGKADERKGRVLVATQVIEQSLDLDFDLMVSDLAPIDLLIQRAGRLWRHMDLRPEDKRPVGGPTLLVVSPDPDKVEDENWLFQLEHKGAYVYRNHALLWRTAKLLFDKQEFSAPEDLRGLIETVYANPPSDDTPEILRDCDLTAEGDKWGDSTLAEFNLLTLNAGYARAGSWLEETSMPTRLGEETRLIRLARISKDKLRPLHNCPDEKRAWSLSEVSLSAKWLRDAEISTPWRTQIDSIRQTWPRFQRQMLIVPVDENGNLLLDNLPSPLVYGKNGLEKPSTNS